MSLTDPAAKAMADGALGRLAQMYMEVGDQEKLSALLNSVRDRSLTGPATEQVAKAAGQLQAMQRTPEYAFRCGAAALLSIVRLKGDISAEGVLLGARATKQGMSLAHYAAIIGQSGGLYEVAGAYPGDDLWGRAVEAG